MKFSTILAAVIFFSVSVMSIGGCANTGDVKADATSYINSPAVQVEIEAVQALAFDYVNKFLQSHLGGTTKLTVKSPSVVKSINAATKKIATLRPAVAPDIIRAQVTAQMANALAGKG